MKPTASVLAFLDRLADLKEAHAILVQIGFLRKAAELAPAAAPALAAREAELHARRLAINPPVILCPDCGYEWAGRRHPRLRCSYRGGKHD